MEDSAISAPSSSIWTSLNSWFTSTVFFVLLNLMIATIVFTSNLPNNHHQHQDEQQQQQHNHHQQREDEQQQQNRPHDRNRSQIARSPSILHRLRSLNFYPKKSQHESSTETQYQQNPLEAAATQYVFNQSLDYQHFDPDLTDSDHTLDQFHGNATAHYDFDTTRQETGEDTGFDFDPTRQDSHEDARFDFESTRQYSPEDTRFDFDPARQELLRGNTGFDFEPADEEHTDEFQSLDEVYSKLKTGRHDRTKSDGSIRPNPPLKMKKSTSLKVGFSHLDEEDIFEARRPATVREKKPAVDDDDVEVDSRADDFINKFKNDLKLQRIESIIRTKGTTNRGTGK